MIDAYIRQYGRRLYGLCLTLCGNRQDAEDLYQDTWLRVLHHLDRYDPSLPFEPWLTQICVNTYRNALRRMRRSPFFNSFSTSEDKDRVLNEAAAPEKDDYSDLRSAVDRLPEKLRVTVILYYYRELDISSTALALKIPPGTVKSRLSKARKLLKEALEDESLPF